MGTIPSERLVCQRQAPHLRYGEETPEGDSPRVAPSCDLVASKRLFALLASAVAVGFDLSMMPVVGEFDCLLLLNRFTDDIAHDECGLRFVTNRHESPPTGVKVVRKLDARITS